MKRRWTWGEVVAAIAIAAVFVALLGFAASYVHASEYEAAPLKFKRAFHPTPADLRVVDGDTVKVKGVSYRALGYDTPELHIPCERQRALSAKDRLFALVNDPATRVLIRPATKPDKYGRTLAQIMVGPKGERSAADILIGEGLAHPYDGGKRPPWPNCP